jgi:hypothetical protein
MLFMKGHGGHAIYDYGGYTPETKRLARDACGYRPDEEYPEWDPENLGAFGYLCDGASAIPASSETVAALREIAVEMVDQAPQSHDNSQIPAAFTYIGQFIDHDITAGTDREISVSEIDVPDLTPLKPDEVEANIANLRTGRLDLDSLYGGAVLQGGLANEIVDEKLLRHPVWKAKLRLGTSTPTGQLTVEKPEDPARDVLRLGRLIDSGTIDLDDIDALSDELRSAFTTAPNEVNRQKAIIGDGRNDENLGVSQTHLAMARFHNVCVVHAHKVGGPSDLSSEDTFNFARNLTRWTYQWLIIHDYLPRICQKDVLASVISDKAPFYRKFFERVGPGDGSRLPMPLEFSVAAFRFGHTMARPDYDWNKHFGRDPGTLAERGDFRQLFRLTGGATPPMHVVVSPQGDIQRFPTLPDNWVVDWSRFLDESGIFSDRFTRRLDTHLAPPLLEMFNEPKGMHARMQDLAERNLRRSYRLAIPSAQACIASFADQGVNIATLSPKVLRNGPGGDALERSGMLDATPLWYYILREAEVQTDGETLGQLGSRLVAETLVGLIVNDPNSYWSQPGDDDGRWHPHNSIKPRGKAITSFERLVEASGLI